MYPACSIYSPERWLGTVTAASSDEAFVAAYAVAQSSGLIPRWGTGIYYRYALTTGNDLLPPGAVEEDCGCITFSNKSLSLCTHHADD